MPPLKNRSPPTPPPDLKQRVIICLNKLADRDTLALAAADLDSIARNLTAETFSPFLNCIHTTDDSAKSPVRRKCISLLTLLSNSHGNSLSPHASKMISTVARRLRDSDSAVRSACVEATTAMSSQITRSPFSVFSKPLIELILVEQDANSQIGAGMCLAAAIDSSPDPDAEQLRKLLPRFGKLVKSEGYKGKSALIGVIGSIIGTGGAGSKGILDWVVPSMVELLKNQDWTARKAAAQALGKVAAAEMELAPEYKIICLKALENRRFDKVKVVRETMNRTLELWREVPDLFEEEVVVPSQSKSSSKDGSSNIGCLPSVAKNSNGVVFNTPRPRPKRVSPTSRSPPPEKYSFVGVKDESLLNSNLRPTLSCRVDRRKLVDCETEIEFEFPSSKGKCEDVKMIDSGVLDSVQNEDEKSYSTKTKRVLFRESEKVRGLRSGSRVVPFHDDGEILDVAKSDAGEKGCEKNNDKDVGNLSLIREQLAQIENQQSSLLNLLEKFIGSSQSGINSLETRVHGLEMAVNGISYDLAVSRGRFSNFDSAGNTCWKLPGTEFLTPKFWRKTESRYSASRFPSSKRLHPLNGAADAKIVQFSNPIYPDGGASSVIRTTSMNLSQR